MKYGWLALSVYKIVAGAPLEGVHMGHRRWPWWGIIVGIVCELCLCEKVCYHQNSKGTHPTYKPNRLCVQTGSARGTGSACPSGSAWQPGFECQAGNACQLGSVCQIGSVCKQARHDKRGSVCQIRSACQTASQERLWVLYASYIL